MGQTFHRYQVGTPEGNSADASEVINEKIAKLLNDMDINEVGFNSQAEFLAAVGDPRYSAPGSDGETFRHLVQVMLQNSNLTGDPHSNEGKREIARAEALSEEDRQIAMESAQELFNNPAYETSPTYRKFVREQIAANSALIDKNLGKQINGPTKVNGRIQFTAEDYAEVQAGIAQEREDARKAEIKAQQEAVSRHAEIKYVDVTGMPGQDE